MTKDRERDDEWGRLFGDRYKAIPRRGARASTTWRWPITFISPGAGGVVRLERGEDLLAYAWSSLAAEYALAPKRRAAWQAVGAGLDAFGCPDTAAGRRRYVQRLERRAREEGGQAGAMAPEPSEAGRASLRRGWYWGSQAFAEKLQAFLRGKAG